MRVEWLGYMDFSRCCSLQQERLEIVAAGLEEDPERVYLVEHPDVFTLGRTGDPSNILPALDAEAQTIPTFRINRGGDVTYHGPGQLVGYPILDLRRRGRDVHRHLRLLEEILIGTAAHFGIEACRRPGLTGVWTGAGKLASIGVGVRRWVTQHGFALNVCPDLSYFKRIHPCGIPNCPMVSLSSLLGRRVGLAEVIPWIEMEIQAQLGAAGGLASPVTSALSGESS